MFVDSQSRTTSVFAHFQLPFHLVTFYDVIETNNEEEEDDDE